MPSRPSAAARLGCLSTGTGSEARRVGSMARQCTPGLEWEQGWQCAALGRAERRRRRAAHRRAPPGGWPCPARPSRGRATAGPLAPPPLFGPGTSPPRRRRWRRAAAARAPVGRDEGRVGPGEQPGGRRIVCRAQQGGMRSRAVQACSAALWGNNTSRNGTHACSGRAAQGRSRGGGMCTAGSVQTNSTGRTHRHTGCAAAVQQAEQGAHPLQLSQVTGGQRVRLARRALETPLLARRRVANKVRLALTLCGRRHAGHKVSSSCGGGGSEVPSAHARVHTAGLSSG